MLKLWMGTKMNEKRVNYSHKLDKPNNKLVSASIGTLLMHGQATGIHRLTRLTTAQTL